MTGSLAKIKEWILPQFAGQQNQGDNPYYTFEDYRQIWGMVIFTLGAAALLPLAVVTVIHYQLITTSVDSEFMLRTERLTSNARRAVTFFLEERLNALKFTINETGYDQLTEPGHLSDTLKNLKLGFGGLTDLSVIDDRGLQVAYAGPYNLEGKNYSDQAWFVESRAKNSYVSEIFLGYRGVPHMIIAVKSTRPDGRFFILRATLETERLIQTLVSYQTGEHVDIFLINQKGIVQTPSRRYGKKFGKVSLPQPKYSEHTQALMLVDSLQRSIIMGYAYISSQIMETPFIVVVVKQKSEMMKVWTDLRNSINWFVGFSVVAIVVVISITSTFLVNKLYLTDKAKAETMAMMEQNNQLASIGRLAAGVAHEINNPLALINETAGYVKDLFSIKDEYKDDPELVENIDEILEAVERCGTITRQLLGFARKFDMNVRKVDLKDALNDVLNFHTKEAEYRNISVSVDISEDLPGIVTDRGKLQQVLVNLVNNAFHAMADGCRLRIEGRPNGADKVDIMVSDTGCGISEENMKKIFEPFFTTKSEGKGTGLGLYITYGLIKKLQGELKVESQENIGTTFTVTLPVQIREEATV